MQMTQAVPVNGTKPPSCLIVEDSDFDRERLTRVVQKACEKMHIKAAPTLKSARHALAKGHTSLILLDNNLPDGLGANFALELAQNPQTADIPIIMVSDWPSPFMWEKAASAGVIYVLNKAEFDGRYLHAALRGKQTQRMN